MNANASNEYFSIKITMLKQLLRLSEELISSLEDWESMDGILKKREVVIHNLQLHDESYGKSVLESCTQDQKSQIDQLVNLILNIDKDASKMIRDEKENIIQAIKTNIQEQKLVHYNSTPYFESGKFLDYKK